MTDASPLDLRIERLVPAAPARIWRCLTEPVLLALWWCPDPWRAECRVELRPGGEFFTRRIGPGGESHDQMAVYLELVPERRLVFTDALHPGWRPAPARFLTAVFTMDAEGRGTRYTAAALHATRASRDRHERMGFLDGWNAVTDQLAALAARLDG